MTAEDMNRAVSGGVGDFLERPAVDDIAYTEAGRWFERRSGHAEQQPGAAVFAPQL